MDRAVRAIAHPRARLARIKGLAQTAPAMRPPALAEHPHRITGIVLIASAFALFPVADAAAKYLTDTLHALQITWVRYAVHTAIFAAVTFFRHPLRVLRTRHPGAQFARGAAGFLSHVPFFAALAFIPLADACAVNMVGPLMVTALSVPMLGERVGWRRWSAVALGFIGAMIVVRPGLGLVHWATSLPLLGAAFFAVFQILTRRVSADDHPEGTLMLGTLYGLALSTLALPFIWQAMTWEDWRYILIMSAISGAGHFMMAKAFRMAPASLLAPFAYVQIVSALGSGFLIFGDVPDAYTIFGALIIAASGLYIAHRERLTQRRAA
ncbi:MAG: DMT family transporter [Alphaproteobacteria bacterium]